MFLGREEVIGVLREIQVMQEDIRGNNCKNVIQEENRHESNEVQAKVQGNPKGKEKKKGNEQPSLARIRDYKN